MASTKGQKPGEIAKQSGQGKVVGPRGGDTGKEVTLIKGHRVPPLGRPSETVKITDPTKNKSGRGK